jgi:deoxyribose-phosphate aldolase
VGLEEMAVYINMVFMNTAAKNEKLHKMDHECVVLAFPHGMV